MRRRGGAPDIDPPRERKAPPGPEAGERRLDPVLAVAGIAALADAVRDDQPGSPGASRPVPASEPGSGIPGPVEADHAARDLAVERQAALAAVEAGNGAAAPQGDGIARPGFHGEREGRTGRQVAPASQPVRRARGLTRIPIFSGFRAGNPTLIADPLAGERQLDAGPAHRPQPVGQVLHRALRPGLPFPCPVFPGRRIPARPRSEQRPEPDPLPGEARLGARRRPGPYPGVHRKGKTDTARAWVYVRDDAPFGGPDPPAALFRYARDRSGDHPVEHLQTFAGILQADAYAGYRRLYAAGRSPGPVIEALCWSHGRRKFYELADIAAGKRRGKRAPPISPLALEAVKRIDALFDIEREINGEPAGQRLAVRQERSALLVAELEDWMRTERATLSRHAAVAKAMDYMLKRWGSFARFLDDGQICLRLIPLLPVRLDIDLRNATVSAGGLRKSQRSPCLIRAFQQWEGTQHHALPEPRG